jgi:AraC family transcriptional regulator
MDWLERMNGAISYIERNLCSDIDYEEAARIACCSTYHFQRMFSFITDVPLSEYIRRRRLTLAAFDLQNTDVRIIDIALKYGYDSPNSFTRAFQNLHGVTPSLARDRGVQLKAYPCISFYITIKGDVEMNYKIEEKGAFKVFGVEAIIDSTNNENFIKIPKFWDQCRGDGTLDRLCSIQVVPKVKGLCDINSIMCYRDINDTQFPYMIGVVDFEGSTKVPEGLVTVEVKPYTWAIFRTEDYTMAEATGKIQAVWKRIFPEWFPTSGYEHDMGPELELTYHISGDKYYTEVWIPVVKK